MIIYSEWFIYVICGLNLRKFPSNIFRPQLSARGWSRRWKWVMANVRNCFHYTNTGICIPSGGWGKNPLPGLSLASKRPLVFPSSWLLPCIFKVSSDQSDIPLSPELSKGHFCFPSMLEGYWDNSGFTYMVKYVKSLYSEVCKSAHLIPFTTLNLLYPIF